MECERSEINTDPLLYVSYEGSGFASREVWCTVSTTSE